jgi:hypothetical protein
VSEMPQPEMESQKRNPFDHDMAALESLDTELDRGRQALETYREAVGLQHSPFYGDIGRGYLHCNNAPDWGQSFDLPTMHGHGSGTVRPSQSETWTNKTPEHIFIGINQETMWKLSLKEGPVAHATMSECASLIGRSPSSLWFAHIGYATVTSFEASLAAMKAGGVDPASMLAILPVEDSLDQSEIAARASMPVDSYMGPRMTFDDCVGLGLDAERIVPFKYRYEVNANVAVGHNLLTIIARPEEVYIATQDYLFPSRQGGSRNGKFIGDPTMEQVIPLSPSVSP